MRSIIIAATTAFALAGCAQTSPDVYSPYEVGAVAYTEMGTVAGARPVEVSSPGGIGIGATVGALAGGIAGSQIGPNRRGYRRRGSSDAVSALGAVGGALIGGLIGAAIERDVTRQTAVEYTVRLDDGALITIVQGARPLAIGQRVFVQTPSRGRARLVPAA